MCLPPVLALPPPLTNEANACWRSNSTLVDSAVVICRFARVEFSPRRGPMIEPGPRPDHAQGIHCF